MKEAKNRFVSLPLPVLFVVLLINLYKFRRPEHKEALSEVITAKSLHRTFLVLRTSYQEERQSVQSKPISFVFIRTFFGVRVLSFSFFQFHRTRVQLLPGLWNLFIYLFTRKVCVTSHKSELCSHVFKSHHWSSGHGAIKLRINEAKTLIGLFVLRKIRNHIRNH